MFFKTAFDQFISTLDTAVTSVSTTMSGTLSGPISAAMTLYIMFLGISVVRGQGGMGGVDFCMHAIKLGVIHTLVTNPGLYNTWVGSTITVGVPEFVTAVLGGTGTLPADSIFTAGDDVVLMIEEHTSNLKWKELAESIYYSFLGLIVVFCTLVTCAISFAYSVLIHFALALVAAVGPIFICFALFNFSRGWFFSWLGQALNFLILSILLNVLGIIIVAFIEGMVAAGNGVDLFYAACGAIAACIVSVFIFFLLPSLAAGMTQGAQASTGFTQRVVERGLGGKNNDNNSNDNKPTNGSVSQS